MGSTTVVLVALVAVVATLVAAEDIATFRRLINKSRAECRRDRSPASQVRATCAPPPDPRTGRSPLRDITTGELLDQIPGGLTTVKQYSAGRARFDLYKTATLCEERESEDGAKSWKNIDKTARVEMRLTPRTEVYSECQAQMEREKRDCADIKNILCAFKNHQAFECAPDNQRDREAGTIDETDQCFAFAFFNYGRPTTLKDFRARQRSSKLNCRRDKDMIEMRCGRKDETLQQIVASLPNDRAYSFDRDIVVAKMPEIQAGLDDCLLIERYGYAKLRVKANQELRGVQNADQRRRCLATLADDQTDRCKQVNDVMCAYSYGTDLSCKPEAQSLTRESDACAPVIAAIAVEMGNGK